MQARHASFFVSLFALAPLAVNAQYAYDIISLDNAAASFHPTGLNNNGQISGYAYVPVSYNGATSIYGHAFYYSGGQLQDVAPDYPRNDYGEGINDAGSMVIAGDAGGAVYNINTGKEQDLPGSGNLKPNGINQNGAVVGTFFDTTAHANRPFIYQTGTKQIQYLSDPAGAIAGASRALAINNNGDAVGDSSYTNGGGHATFYHNGVGRDLGNQTNGVNTLATGINDAGDLCGYSDILRGNGVQQSFLYRNGQYITLGTLPGETNIYAYGVSNDGDVIGATDKHPFIYHNGQLSNLFDLVDPSLGWTLGSAYAVNDSGWIVGYGNRGGFLMKPHATTPAPGSLCVFAIGLGAGLLALRRRTRAPLAR